jgi:hypothetical protein
MNISLEEYHNATKHRFNKKITKLNKFDLYVRIHIKLI